VSGIQNLVLTQLNVETNKVLHEEELGGQETLVKLEFISGDVYKVSQSKIHDCLDSGDM